MATSRPARASWSSTARAASPMRDILLSTISADHGETWRGEVVREDVCTESGPLCEVDSSGCLAYHLAWCTRCWHAWSLPQRCASYLRSEECYGRYSDRPGPGDPKSGHRG